jgi:hypothetical protein
VANYQSITPLQLGQAAITTSYTTIYTVPTTTPNATRTYLKDFDIINTTSSIVYIYVSLVPSAGTAGTGNALMYNNALPAYTTMQWTGSQILNAGTTIQVKASAVGCTITASGGEAA